jgi:hypothetical protein
MTIQSAAENQFVVDNVLRDFSSAGGPNLSNLPLWIGLYDPAGAAHDDGPGGAGSQHEANFLWADGSTLAYRNWNVNTGEPTDSNNNEYYTAINWHYAGDATAIGTWNDAPLNGSVIPLRSNVAGESEHLAVSFGRRFNRLQRADP